MDIARLAISITAVDAASNIIGNVRKNFKTLTGDIKQLIANGQKMQAFSKGISALGSYALGASSTIGAAVGLHQKAVASMDMGEGMNKIAVLTGKSQAEIEHFRAKIHEIAAETGRGQEEIMAVSSPTNS
jgi:hypothetical protein